MTAHTRIGARTDSNNMRSETSADLMYLGPIARRQDAPPMNKPWPKIIGHWMKNAFNGSVNKLIIIAPPRYANGRAGIMEVDFTERTVVNAAAKAPET